MMIPGISLSSNLLMVSKMLYYFGYIIQVDQWIVNLFFVLSKVWLVTQFWSWTGNRWLKTSFLETLLVRSWTSLWFHSILSAANHQEQDLKSLGFLAKKRLLWNPIYLMAVRKRLMLPTLSGQVNKTLMSRMIPGCSKPSKLSEISSEHLRWFLRLSTSQMFVVIATKKLDVSARDPCMYVEESRHLKIDCCNPIP